MRWDDVVAMGLELPGVEASTWYRTPALKIAGKGGFVRLKEDGESFVLLVEPDAKGMLLESAPQTFHTTPHYDGYPFVLVRLAKITKSQLRPLLRDAWRQVAPAKLQREAAASSDTLKKTPAKRAPTSTAKKKPSRAQLVRSRARQEK